MKKCFILILLFFISFQAIGYAQKNPIIPQSLSFTGTFFSGPVSGFVQIPKGGKPSSSDTRRPTLSELGIHHNNNYDFEFNANWEKINLYAGYHIIRPRGSVILDTILRTHDRTIWAGSNISAEINFDWYRVGTKYILHFNKFTVAPLAEIAVLRFGYDIPHYIEPRDFDATTARIGIYGAYYFTNKIFLSANLAGSIPISDLNIYTIASKLNYTLFQKRYFTPTIFLGAQYTYIDFEDHQELPNHMRFEQTTFLIGITIALGSINIL